MSESTDRVDTPRRSSALTGIQLGLGLTQLGRRWGFRAADVPAADDAQALLAFAVDAGVRVFDTAPSYGTSEERLGRFLSALEPRRRATLVVMTKCGERWNESVGEPLVDHRYESLVRSIDHSLERLQRIDVLQLHRGSADVLRSNDVRRALGYARSLGISAVGASVSDMESARIAINELKVSVLQFPYNRENARMEPAFELACAARCAVVINRPLAMGRLAYPEATSADPEVEAVTSAYRFVLARRFDGAVLTGTSSAAHLAADMECFARAM